MISLIIQRFDNGSLNDKASIENYELMQLFPKHHLIDNSNLGRDCIGNKDLHLNQLGTRHLARNFNHIHTGGEGVFHLQAIKLLRTPKRNKP